MRSACDRGAVGVLLCCVVVVSRELRFAVNRCKVHWGNGGPSVVMIVAGSAVIKLEVPECVVDRCGVTV